MSVRKALPGSTAFAPLAWGGFCTAHSVQCTENRIEGYVVTGDDCCVYLVKWSQSWVGQTQ